MSEIEERLRAHLDLPPRTQEKPLHVRVAEAAKVYVARGRYPGRAGERFYRLVDFRPGDCWYWRGSRGEQGHGRVKILGRAYPAHVVSFVLSGGIIPDGMELDHLCRTPECVNPTHVEPVTHRENVARGLAPIARQMAMETCLNGHSFSNMTRRGRRNCRACARKYQREYWVNHPEFREAQRSKMRERRLAAGKLP